MELSGEMKLARTQLENLHSVIGIALPRKLQASASKLVYESRVNLVAMSMPFPDRASPV